MACRLQADKKIVPAKSGTKKFLIRIKWLVDWSVINEKVKNFTEPGIWLWRFFHKRVFRPLVEKTEFSVVEKAKEEYLSLAGRDQISP